jgi:predicted RNase H-like HicB family nuclease
MTVRKTSLLSKLTVTFDREEDGRWIAEITRLPGVMAYGATKREAERRVRAIALRTLADTLEQGKTPAAVSHLFGYAMASR